MEPQNEPPRKKPAGRRWTYRAVGLGALGVAVVAFSLSEPGPRHPTVVSGRAAPKVSQSGAAVRWWKNKVTITMDASLADVGPGAEDAVRGGFGTWLANDEKLPKLRFDSSSSRKAVKLSADGENRVYFAPITIAGHENDLAITLAYTDPEGGEVVEADIVLNAKHAYGILQAPPADDGKANKAKGTEGATLANVMAPSCKTTYDVQSVATHEIGHFFGLGEDTTDADATMYFSTIPCDLGKRDLSAGDATVMSSLYAEGTQEAAAESSDGSPAATSCAVSRTGGNTPAGAGFALALGALALTARRRR